MTIEERLRERATASCFNVIERTYPDGKTERFEPLLVEAADLIKEMREALRVILHDYRCRLKEAGYAHELIDEFTTEARATLSRAESSNA